MHRGWGGAEGRGIENPQADSPLNVEPKRARSHDPGIVT